MPRWGQPIRALLPGAGCFIAARQAALLLSSASGLPPRGSRRPALFPPAAGGERGEARVRAACARLLAAPATPDRPPPLLTVTVPPGGRLPRPLAARVSAGPPGARGHRGWAVAEPSAAVKEGRPAGWGMGVCRARRLCPESCDVRDRVQSARRQEGVPDRPAEIGSRGKEAVWKGAREILEKLFTI